MKKMVKMCWSTSVDDRDSALNKGSKGKVKGLLWYKSLGHHMFGEFSMGVMQANSTLEDQSQVECGPLGSLSSGPIGTFVGIYDGHGGPQAAHFANNNLFKNLKRCTNDRQEISADAIRKAFMVTEEEFISMVRQRWLQKPTLASSGTCCLAGIICNGEIYTANAGDSRVVLGTINRVTKRIEAIQLSNDHNAQIESEREELRSCHPHDPNIVVMKHKAWRVKGIIQVTRSIGDAYLKSSEFNREPLLQRYRVSGPLYMPILRAQPSISVRKLENEDQFLVFASDGLWENLSNNEVVDIVSKSPRFGIARKLIKAALKRAANKREMRYSDLKKIDAGVRRHFHDDITVVVVFIDHSLLHRSAAAAASPFSIKGGAGAGIAGVSQGGPVAVGDCSN